MKPATSYGAVRDAYDGATDSSLNMGQVTESSSGSYDVFVSNVVGPVPSGAAVLTVNDPVEIGTPPASQTVNPGTVVSFSLSSHPKRSQALK